MEGQIRIFTHELVRHTCIHTYTYTHMHRMEGEIRRLTVQIDESSTRGCQSCAPKDVSCVCLCMYIYIYTYYTHTHTHVYILSQCDAYVHTHTFIHESSTRGCQSCAPKDVSCVCLCMYISFLSVMHKCTCTHSCMSVPECMYSCV